MTTLLTAGCMAMLTVFSAHALEQPAGEITLRVEARNVPGMLLTTAEREAARILSQAGVQVRWKSPDQPRTAGRHGPECTDQAVDVSDISILIQDRTATNDHPGALAYAMPFAPTGFRVVIFYDRVLFTTDRPSAELLGHVIAHEVGHMLIGTVSHAPAGVMKARWTVQELAVMRSHPLPFASSDTAMIARRFSLQRLSCQGRGPAATQIASQEGEE
jgi:hypothetical protein